jgi:hypothetical protein
MQLIKRAQSKFDKPGIKLSKQILLDWNHSASTPLFGVLGLYVEVFLSIEKKQRTRKVEGHSFNKRIIIQCKKELDR